MKDWEAAYPKLFELHGAPVQPPDEGPDWESVLAATPEEDRLNMELLRNQVDGQPVRLVCVPGGGVALEAPASWQAQHTEAFAAAALALHDMERETIRNALAPHLEEVDR